MGGEDMGHRQGTRLEDADKVAFLLKHTNTLDDELDGAWNEVYRLNNLLEEVCREATRTERELEAELETLRAEGTR